MPRCPSLIASDGHFGANTTTQAADTSTVSRSDACLRETDGGHWR